MMMRELLVFIMIFASLVGCSSGKTPAPASAPHVVRFDTKVEALAYLDGADVQCQGFCPEYVGAFYMYSVLIENGITQHQVGMCSITLIGEKTILTNHHCIEKLFKKGDLCDGTKNSEKPYIEIKFPATGTHPFEVAKCKKISDTSEVVKFKDPSNGQEYTSRHSPDWAIIELQKKPGQRSPVPVSIEKIGKDAVVDLYPVFFTTQQSPPKGQIRHVQCRRGFSWLGPFFYDEDGPIMLLNNCSVELIPGTSGSGQFFGSKLIGLHASGEGTDSNGTAAMCLPGYETPDRPCTFTTDTNYIDILRVYMYLDHYKNPKLGQFVDKNPQYFDENLFRWGASKLASENLRHIEMHLNPPWSDYFEYLSGIGDSRLAAKIKYSLAQSMMARFPECVHAGAVGAEMRVPIINLQTWDLLPLTTWTQKFVGYDTDGRELTRMEATLTDTGSSLYPVLFQVSKNDSGIVLESAGEKEPTMFPSSLKKMRFSVPYCQ